MPFPLGLHTLLSGIITPGVWRPYPIPSDATIPSPPRRREHRRAFSPHWPRLTVPSPAGSGTAAGAAAAGPQPRKREVPAPQRNNSTRPEKTLFAETSPPSPGWGALKSSHQIRTQGRWDHDGAPSGTILSSRRLPSQRWGKSQRSSHHPCMRLWSSNQ